MASTLEQLRRKTPVLQRNYEDVLVLTFSLWMPFLMPPDPIRKRRIKNCTWSSAKHVRMLSKRFPDAWKEYFHSIVLVRQDCLLLLRTVVPSNDGSCRILDELVEKPLLYREKYWLVEMPWLALRTVFRTVMTIWPIRWSLPRVIFLDACWNAYRTPVIKSYDIRVLRSMGLPTSLYELRGRWAACALFRELSGRKQEQDCAGREQDRAGRKQEQDRDGREHDFA